jgi:hypothetical protein
LRLPRDPRMNPPLSLVSKSKGFGGKGIRTPDIQLAKLALYQLSYAPDRMAECKWKIADCKKWVAHATQEKGPTKIKIMIRIRRVRLRARM